jgi:Putative esterase
MSVTRRSSLVALLGLAAGGCGGGSGATAPAMAGSTQTGSISSQSNGTTYPLFIYLPPGTVAIRANLPTVYLLDGESRFQTLVDIVEMMHAQVMIVAIGNQALRARDYVPANICTPGGGGQAAFLQFIGTELVPFVESDLRERSPAAHPAGPLARRQLRRVRALQRGPGRPPVRFLPGERLVDRLHERDRLRLGVGLRRRQHHAPVRLHVSYAANAAGNISLVQQVQSRGYTGLALVSQIYGGGHGA